MAPRETSGRTRTASDAPILSADAYVQAVGSFLESEQPAAAKEMAALAVELFPGHAELEKMNRVLNPSQVTVSSYQGPDRTWEFDWLRRNRDAYRGQWVALGGGELIAASDNVQDLIRAVRARDLDGHPLVHCVE
jgi:hypothetical protein